MINGYLQNETLTRYWEGKGSTGLHRAGSTNGGAEQCGAAANPERREEELVEKSSHAQVITLLSFVLFGHIKLVPN